MKDCTFNPNLNLKSLRMAKNRQSNQNQEEYLAKLHEKHAENMQRRFEQALQKKLAEERELTFKPKLIAKKPKRKATQDPRKTQIAPEPEPDELPESLYEEPVSQPKQRRGKKTRGKEGSLITATDRDPTPPF
jgi:ATP adenylyltransferase/5',5'''-P-1,P-4-tetraphosphate phosphorylase II